MSKKSKYGKMGKDYSYNNNNRKKKSINSNFNNEGKFNRDRRTIREQIKSIESELNYHRENIFDYYKNYHNALQIHNNSNFNYINNGYNKKELSDEELYETFGKYLTYYKNGEIVFYTDTNLYKGKENKVVNNFQNLIIGFPNIGNSCYMNAFLQILLHTPNFLKNLYEYNYKNFDKETLIYNLVFLSKYPLNSDYLKKIKKIMGNVNPKYETYTPGDSQSFAIDFLDQLISECKDEYSNEDSYESNYDEVISKTKKYSKFCENYNNKKDKIEKLFQFTEIYPGSSIYNYNFSVNLNIELSFPLNCNNIISLIDLLNIKYSNNNIDKYKKPKLADLPEILIISIVRGIEGKNVIKTNVSFNEELNLNPYLDSELINNLKSSSYQLYAINERYGQFKSQGHYVSFIKINNKKWYRFSDLYVIESFPPLSSPDVFGLYYIRKDCIPKFK